VAMSELTSPAKQVLLRALDNIEAIEQQTGGEVSYLIVCHATIYSPDDEDASRTVRGWDATDHPHFVHIGLLREVATVLERDSIHDEDEDE
jgi:hypothetical protein